MTSHELLAAAAAGRQRDLLAEATTRRLRREAREHAHRAGATDVVLRDGSQVLIRQIGPADTDLLADAFTRLSPRSRRLRFLGPKKALTAAELRYLTHIDHDHHEAIGALHRSDGRGLGVARYIRSTDDPLDAECAVTVVDAWHRRGLGTELLARLADRARRAGIRRFTGLVASDNVAMVNLLLNLRAEVCLVPDEASTVRFAVSLGSTGVGAPLASTLAP